LLGGLLHADQHTQPIDAHNSRPIRLGGIQELARFADARVVEHDIEPAIGTNRRFDQRLYTSAIHNVDGDGNGLSAILFYGGSDTLGSGQIEIGDDNASALYRKIARYSLTDAAAATGHDDRFSLDKLCHFFLLGLAALTI
jgi:hypothetical protein